jgi:hypothetical protein
MADDKKLDPVADPLKKSKLVSSSIKSVTTNTGQDNPDRMEVINTIKGRINSRMSDEREKALRKVRKTNNTIAESKPTGNTYVDMPNDYYKPHDPKSKKKLKKEEVTMSENMDVMIDAVLEKRPGDFKSALSAEMSERAAAMISGYKSVVAQSMFQPDEVEDADGGTEE